ncbi:MAG: type I restriction-modification system subunit M N-terminal domain-containing protein, partial [Candidatus Limnocylindria bacterium]
MARTKRAAARNNGRGDLGFEATLWLTADKLRGNLDSGEYKHVVLGLIFLKYISDAFEEARAEVAADPEGESEDRDEYASRNV